jgi:cytochrome c551/c552
MIAPTMAIQEVAPQDYDAVDTFVQRYGLNSGTFNSDRQRERWFDRAEIQDYAQIFIESQVGLGSPMRELVGPSYPELSNAYAAVTERLRAIDRRLNPDIFAFGSYRSEATKILIDEAAFSRKEWEAIEKVGRFRDSLLTGIGRMLLNQHAGTVVDALDDPGFAWQGDDWATIGTIVAQKSCFNACFRMAVRGITGQKPAESAVAFGAHIATGTVLPDDTLYMEAFGTPTFQAKYGESAVRVLSMTGATLGRINEIATKLKQHKAERKVMAILSILSEKSLSIDDVVLPRSIIWHSYLLLGAAGDTVTVHDPSERMGRDGGKARDIHVESFYRRWPFALNRAHLVVVDPA